MEIKREFYLNKLVSHQNNGFIKIISGIRRCGKSYLLFELFKNYLKKIGVSEEHIISIALDDRRYKEYLDPDNTFNFVTSSMKDDKMYYLLLDEVQLMNDFENVLNSFLHIKNLDVYVTGSNSRFLSTDIVTEFRGRGDEIRVYPLSFSEYYSALNVEYSIAIDSYFTYGGMPALFKFNSDEEKGAYLDQLFNLTYIRDVIDRNGIKNEIQFGELVDIIASSIGSLTNPKKLSDTFQSVQKSKISEATIKQYIKYLEEAFLIDKVLRYDIKGKRYLSSPFKCYFADVGLRNSRLNFRQIEYPHIMENLIYNELVMRGFKVDVGNIEVREKNEASNIYTRRLNEVDFVINKGAKRYYIQSAYSIDSIEKKMQEEKSLNAIKDSFKKIIIIKDTIIPRYENSGILILGLKDFLLNPASLDF